MAIYIFFQFDVLQVNSALCGYLLACSGVFRKAL